jgi:predicted NUDIX family phosphoesterase/dephospho-CoA kinase
MAGKFLRAAYELLDKHGKPLSAQQIVDFALQKGLLRSAGKTPTNTMRARLSDDIRTNGVASDFQRAGANRFALRTWTMHEYHARPFAKELPDETTVCLRAVDCEPFGAGGVHLSTKTAALLKYLCSSPNLHFLARKVAEHTTAFRQLISYVWLETADGLVLSYTRGKYSSAHKTLLLGKRSVGFGGHVLKQDAEGLFGSQDAGVVQAAIREIGEELGGRLPTDLAVHALIWDDSSFEGQKHVGVVLRGHLPHSSQLEIGRSRELAISGLRLMTKPDLWAQFHSLEFWSQLLLKKFGASARPRNISSIAPSRRPREIGHIVLVGEIANGKSWLALQMANRLRYNIVSASNVLKSILGVEHMHERDRLDFQSKALEFIQSNGGPEQLANGIARAVNASPEPSVIDGLRQLSTLAALRKLISNLTVIYIDCPRDLAFQNYRTRLPTASARQFAAVREHNVEAELPLFRFECDALLNNADSSQKTLDLLTHWLQGVNYECLFGAQFRQPKARGTVTEQ